MLVHPRGDAGFRQGVPAATASAPAADGEAVRKPWNPLGGDVAVVILASEAARHLGDEAETARGRSSWCCHDVPSPVASYLTGRARDEAARIVTATREEAAAILAAAREQSEATAVENTAASASLARRHGHALVLAARRDAYEEPRQHSRAAVLPLREDPCSPRATCRTSSRSSIA